MLNEFEIDEISTDVLKVYGTMEKKIIIDIAKRVNSAGIFTPKIEEEMKKLQEKGYSSDKIRREVRKILESDRDFKKHVAENNNNYNKNLKKVILGTIVAAKKISQSVLQKSAEKTFKDDVKRWKELELKQLKDKNLNKITKIRNKQIINDLKPITKTLGIRTNAGNIPINRAYQTELNTAIQKVVSGKYTFEQALSECVKDLGKSGVRTINYKTNRSYDVVSYARTAMSTSINQLCGDVMNDNIKQTGVKYIEVDTTQCPRDSHGEWEGQVYTYDEFVDATGYGDESDPDNIYSFNCGHHHFPLKYPDQAQKFSKPSKTVTYEGQKIDRFDASQVLRRTEREIRDEKREKMLADELGLSSNQNEARISEKRSFYNDFCNQTGIDAKTHRMNTYE